jgi:hypothetical protein
MMRAVDTITYKKKKGMRVEFTADEYTNQCIEKIKARGFGSRKAAIIYAVQKVAEMGEEEKK